MIGVSVTQLTVSDLHHSYAEKTAGSILLSTITPCTGWAGFGSVAPQGQQRLWTHQLLKDQMMTDQHQLNSLPSLALAASGASSSPSRECLGWPRLRLDIARGFCIIQPTEMCVPEPQDTRRLSESTMIPKNVVMSLCLMRFGLDTILPHQIDRYLSHSLFNWIDLVIYLIPLSCPCFRGMMWEHNTGLEYTITPLSKRKRHEIRMNNSRRS